MKEQFLNDKITIFRKKTRLTNVSNSFLKSWMFSFGPWNLSEQEILVSFLLSRLTHFPVTFTSQLHIMGPTLRSKILFSHNLQVSL